MSEAYHRAEYADKRKGPYVPALIAPLQMREGAVFLDLGCGSGYVNAYVAENLKPSDNIGIDYEAPTIEMAKEFNKDVPSIRWMCASAENIPLPDASIDYIVCRGVVPLAHVDTVFNEIGRILRPGGKIVFLLHSWRFYPKWLSWTNWKRNIFAGVHFAIGSWFNLTGMQIQIRTANHMIGQTWQSESRATSMLKKHGMHVFKMQKVPEFLVYAEKKP